MKRTKAEADQTRDALIEAGLTVFGKLGIQAARVEDIVAEAGVTRGAFYYYFKNKYELYVRLLEIRAAYYKEIIHDCLESDLPPVERIQAYMVKVMTRAVTDPRFMAFNEMILHKSPQVDAALGKLKMNEKERMIPTAVFKTVIEEGIAADQIRTELDVGAAVTNIFIFVHGAITFSIINRNRFHLEDQANSLVRTFLSGYLCLDTDRNNL